MFFVVCTMYIDHLYYKFLNISNLVTYSAPNKIDADRRHIITLKKRSIKLCVKAELILDSRKYVYFLRKRENLIIPLQAYDSTPSSSSSSSKVLTLLNAKKHKAFKHTPYIIPLNCTTAPFTK